MPRKEGLIPVSSGWSGQGAESVEVVSMFVGGAGYPKQMSAHLEDETE